MYNIKPKYFYDIRYILGMLFRYMPCFNLMVRFKTPIYHTRCTHQVHALCQQQSIMWGCCQPVNNKLPSFSSFLVQY